MLRYEILSDVTIMEAYSPQCFLSTSKNGGVAQNHSQSQQKVSTNISRATFRPPYPRESCRRAPRQHDPNQLYEQLGRARRWT